jgi:hypothetical protein
MNIQNTRSLYSSTHCTHVLWKNVGAFCHCVSVRVCMFDENSMSFKDFFFENVDVCSSTFYAVDSHLYI